jgi:hypothetical protein
MPELTLRDGSLSCTQAQAALLREHGTLTVDEAVVILRKHSELWVCDFCSEPGATHAYPCRDFKAVALGGGVEHWSKADWAACDECSALIEDGDVETLTYRSVDLAMAGGIVPGHMRKEVAGLLSQVHQKFMENRI